MNENKNITYKNFSVAKKLDLKKLEKENKTQRKHKRTVIQSSRNK